MDEERGSEKQDSCMVLRFGRTSSTDIVAVLGFAELTVTTRRAGMCIISPFLFSSPRIIYLNGIYCFSPSTSLNPLLHSSCLPSSILICTDCIRLVSSDYLL